MTKRKTVLVTRPESGLTATINRLQALGHHGIAMPLSKIEPIRFIVPDISKTDAILLTSQNAVMALASSNMVFKSDLPTFCVGEQTAKLAKANGFDVVQIAAIASELATHLIDHLNPRTNLIYFCGVEHRPDLETILQNAGHIVLPVETYQAVALLPDQNTIDIVTHNAPCDAVLLYAPSAARFFSNMCYANPDLATSLNNVPLLCLSEQVQLALDASFRQKSFVANQPNEQSLFALLQNHG